MSGVGHSDMDPIINMHPSFGWFIALLIFITTGAAAWRAVGVPLLRGIHKTGNFLDEWNGNPEENRESVPQRIKMIEERLEAVHNQTLMNGGHTLRDAVSRVETQVGEVKKSLEVHLDEARERDKRIEAIETIEATHTHTHIHNAPDSEGSS